MSLRGAVFLCIATAATVLVNASQQVPVTLCNVLNEARTAHAQHAKFAATYYASEYPKLSVTHKYVGVWEPSGVSTQRGVAQAFVLNSSDCTLVIGPGASTLTTALNALINTPWVEFGATATELSSRINYPYFTRVIPNTGIATGSIGLVLQQLGWNSVNVFVSSSSYGLSVASSIASSLGPQGRVIRSDSVPNNISANDTMAILTAYLKSSTKVLVVGLTSTDAAQATFIAAATAMNLTDHLVVFFSEGMCSGSNTWTKMRGSFCISTAINSTNTDPFLNAYWTTRNTAAEVAQFVALGFPASKVDTTGTGSYQSLAADAARFALRALGQYAAQYGTLSGASTATLVNAIGNHVMTDGLTGHVGIASATGDRVGASFVIMNAQPGLTAVPAFNVTAQGNVSVTNEVYVLGNYYALSSVPPLSDMNLSSASVDSSATAIGIGAVVVVVAGIFLVAATYGIPRYASWKRLRAAPRDESQPFTIVFTDIERSTALWAEIPELMGAVLDKHHAIIRSALEAHGGYEVKTIGDSFMCAFESAEAAIAFAVAVQDGLQRGDFPREVDDFYREMMRELGIARPADYRALWHGVRVRIGMHSGTGSIVYDSVQNIYDYYGSVVNTAARIESMGHGGQILASESTMQMAGYRSAAAADRVEVLNGTATASAVGAVVLRGVPQPVTLFDIRTQAFALRTFPSIRVMFAEEDAANDSEGSISSDVEGNALIAEVFKQIELANNGGLKVQSAQSTPRSLQSSAVRRRRSSSSKTGLAALLEANMVEARDRVRRVLAIKLKRGCTMGVPEAKHRAAVAMELFLGLNAMLRVMPTGQRTRLLNDAGTAWRIPRARTSPNEADHDHELIMLLSVKVVQVLGAGRVLSTDFKHVTSSTDNLLDSTDFSTTEDSSFARPQASEASLPQLITSDKTDPPKAL